MIKKIEKQLRLQIYLKKMFIYNCKLKALVNPVIYKGFLYLIVAWCTFYDRIEISVSLPVPVLPRNLVNLILILNLLIVVIIALSPAQCPHYCRSIGRKCCWFPARKAGCRR